MNQQSHRRLISGQNVGHGSGLLRFLLGIAAMGYSLAVWLRNSLYSQGWLKAHRVDAAVICVGNITVGGTGKTPLVVWLYEQVAPRYKCAILTRGYKSTKNSKLKTQNYIDEPAMLAESCPGAKIVVNPDRVAGAAEAIEKFGAEVLIMDDGFQHRRLARDLDIVAIDATQPFGYGKMLPAGLLREPATSLKRAGAIVITRCDQVSEAQLNRLNRQLQELNPDMVIAKSIHAPASIEYATPLVIPAKTGIQERATMDSCLRRNDSVERLKGKKVFAFCGIGNPDAFLNTLKGLGAEVAGSKIFDDHHHYTKACLQEIRDQAGTCEADLILTTQKDWTKLTSNFRSQISSAESSIPFAFLPIRIQFLNGENELKHLIEGTLAGRITRT